MFSDCWGNLSTWRRATKTWGEHANTHKDPQSNGDWTVEPSALSAPLEEPPRQEPLKRKRTNADAACTERPEHYSLRCHCIYGACAVKSAGLGQQKACITNWTCGVWIFVRIYHKLKKKERKKTQDVSASATSLLTVFLFSICCL